MIYMGLPHKVSREQKKFLTYLKKNGFVIRYRRVSKTRAGKYYQKGTQSANIISTTMRDHIDILSEISMEMIQKDNQGKYYCTLIDNELKVVKALNHNIFLKGKIDSLIINRAQGDIKPFYEWFLTVYLPNEKLFSYKTP